MKHFIVLNSKYNLVTEDMQSKENYFIRENQSIEDIPNDVDNMLICGYGNSLNRLEFSQSFSKMKSISIGRNCFEHVREFVIDGLESLESVKIGEECFKTGYKERVMEFVE